MIERTTHECLQGTSEWMSLRANYFTASEAAAAIGESKYQKRADLLKQKSTGIVPDVDAGTQRLFDAGHAAEESARPIVEGQLGTELFPVTMSAEVEGLPLLASLDGISMLGDMIWENKLLNESLKAEPGRWQDAQEMPRPSESRSSKKSAFPSCTDRLVSGLFSGTGGCGQPAGRSNANSALSATRSSWTSFVHAGSIATAINRAKEAR